ncbi:hypothetical protein AB0L25_23195 [Spirillospora sp. NPDC052242]
MSPRWTTAKFLITTGPAALFDRIRQIMDEPVQLKVHAAHAQARRDDRDAPLDELRDFDPSTWELVSAEVRTDTGKWVKSTWRANAAGRPWWIVIGMANTIITVIDIPDHRTGLGPTAIRDGDLSHRVNEVNTNLVQAHTSR